MSIELLKYTNLGSLNDVLFVLRDILSKTPKTLADIRKYCSDKSIEFNYSIDGIIALLEFLEFTTFVKGKIKRSITLEDDWTTKEEQGHFRQTVVKKLFSRLKDTSSLDNFLSSEKIKFDDNTNRIVIHNSSIPLKYSGLKNFLINIGLFSLSPVSPNLLVIAPSFEDFFETHVIPWVVEEEQQNIAKKKKTISMSRFIELQELKNQHGKEAENFVLRYEQHRLKGHSKWQSIRIISRIDITAGYDLVSFETLVSKAPDRFIEVKSYSKEPEFYWSKNEVRVAELKRRRYYLYLVDREVMQQPGYEPIIIQDPHRNVFRNVSWQKDAQNWLVKPEL